MLWLVGIPISVILVLLNRWIPESPRFLLQHGREDEARAVMKRYGAIAVEADEVEGQHMPVRSHYGQLFSRPFTGLTAVLVMLALGIGIVQYGFQQWMPSNLQKLGYDEVNASKVLRDSALIGFPLNFPIALLYGFWSSRRTIMIMATLTAAALLGFVAAGDTLATNSTLLHVLLVVPIWGISSLTAVTAVYASEIYPTRIRGRGTGLAAAATKLGGVLILAAVALAVAAPSILVTALFGGVPIVGAIVMILFLGVETRRRGLEEITAESLRRCSSGLTVEWSPPAPDRGAAGSHRGERWLDQKPAPVTGEAGSHSSFLGERITAGTSSSRLVLPAALSGARWSSRQRRVRTA